MDGQTDRLRAPPTGERCDRTPTLDDAGTRAGSALGCIAGRDTLYRASAVQRLPDNAGFAP